MMRVMHTAVVWALLGVGLIPAGRSSPAQQGQQSRQDYQVNDVVALDALIRLGELYDQPMGIVSGDKNIATARISVRTPKASVQEAIAAVMRELPAYEWREHNGVIVVRPRVLPSVTKRMLSAVIPSIAANNIDIEALSFRLWMELQLQVDPESRRRGFLGVGHLRDYFELGPISFTNVKIEEVLNEIVRRRRSAVWVALPPPDTINGAPLERLWSFVIYANPPKPLDQLCCLNHDYFK